jgi:hypothetical protein
MLLQVSRESPGPRAVGQTERRDPDPALPIAHQHDHGSTIELNNLGPV